MSIFTTCEYLIKRLRELQPRERMIYHTGFLESARMEDPNIDAVAATAYTLMEHEQVVLVQERLGPPVTDYGMIDWERGMGHGFKYMAIGCIPKAQLNLLTQLSTEAA
jgi:hypothetical protein